MKKYVIRGTCFAVAFVLVFLYAQNVLHYRWAQNEDLYSRNLDYANHTENSIDVLYFGTSEAYASYDPIVTYSTAGITGYNFGISNRSAITNYYQLLYALKYQTPSVVMCDFSSMYDDLLPNDVEKIYRKVVACMPDRTLKNDLIRTICEVDPTQSYLNWKLPLLRYHSMWSELERENFLKDPVYNEEYPSYVKGALFHPGIIETEECESLQGIRPELWAYSEKDAAFSELSISFYDKFIETCKSRGIHVVALIPPNPIAASVGASRWDAMEAYFRDRGVDCINYNTYEAFERIGLVLEDDFYNAGHLNVRGSLKTSEVLAQDLCSMYSLQDHRGDSKYYEDWDLPLEEFREVYSGYLVN